MDRSHLHCSLLAILIALAPALAPGAPDYSRLGKDLTPVGAERAGNADGTIPAWDGGLTQAARGLDAAAGLHRSVPGRQAAVHDHRRQRRPVRSRS